MEYFGFALLYLIYSTVYYKKKEIDNSHLQ